MTLALRISVDEHAVISPSPCNIIRARCLADSSCTEKYDMHDVIRPLTRSIILAAALAVGSSHALAKQEHERSGACRLKSAQGDIEHVVFIIFDNVHFLRDNPNVPSDLEQMPNLLDFVRSNGTLLTNDHTVLISHTANGILSSLTGVY